jgi:exo-1,4-beta-D-glucosaminidase
LWPIDEFWNFHASSENFSNLNRFNKAMNETFGPPEGLEDYLTKAQAMAYDGERAMFEAYARNKYTSTGVIQWMLNNAWPSLYWHLYDYYLQPAGGYFGTRKACEPLHIQYSYDDQSVVVVNNLYQKFSGLNVTADLYDFDLQKRFSQQGLLDIGPDAVERVFAIPPLPRGLAPSVYFLRLSLLDGNRKMISSNFYWLPSSPARIAWNKTLYMDDPPPKDLTYETSVYTPAAPYDDLTILSRLPRLSLTVAASVEPGDEGPRVRVKLKNPTGHLAFQVRLGIRRKNEEMEILPVLWDDDYLELMPGESREVTARFLSQQDLEGNAELLVTGWNIEAETVPLVQSKAGSEHPDGGKD